ADPDVVELVDADLSEGATHRRRQVEGGPAVEGLPGDVGAEALDEAGAGLGAELVALRTDARPERGTDGAVAERPERGDGAADDTPLEPPPPGVDDAGAVGRREGDRCAVGRQHDERQTGPR